MKYFHGRKSTNQTHSGPAAYFSNARVPSITSSVQRVGSSSRPVHRSSDVDFDDIPSPRRPMSGLSHGRRSLGLGLSPGPSRLSLATNPQDLADGLDVDDNFDVGGFDPPDVDESDNEPMQSPSPTPSRRRTSFQQIDEDEEEEEQVEEEVGERTPTSAKSAKAKGKQRQYEPVEDQDMQNGYGGFDDGDMGPPDVEEEVQEEEDREETPKPKKGRGKRNERDENAEEDDRPKPKRKRRDGILREGVFCIPPIAAHNVTICAFSSHSRQQPATWRWCPSWCADSLRSSGLVAS